MSTRATAAPALAIRERISSRAAWPTLVWAATALYVVVLSAESIYDQTTFLTGFDVAVYDQRLWLLSEGRDPFSTLVDKPFLGDHFEPGLVLLTPLYWLGLGVPGMLVAQTIGLALTAPALYSLARACSASPGIASIPALLWLASPAVAAVNRFDFHPSSFAAVLLVLGVLAAIQDRHALLAVTTLLAFSLKEDIPLTYFVLGTVLVICGKRRVGAILAAASTATFLIASLVIQSLSDQYEWQGRRFAGDRGDSFFDALWHMARHPLDTLGDAVANGGPGLVALVLSTGGLALLAPLWALLAAPTVAFNALSAYEFQHDLSHQYHLLAATGLFVAAAVGAGRIGRLGELGRRIVVLGLAAAAVVAITGGIVRHNISSLFSPSERAAIRQALDRIPPDAPVAAAGDLLPQLSQRVDVYTFPEPFVQIDWGSRLTREDMARRASRVRFVALGFSEPIEYQGNVEDVKERLLAEGWAVTARIGRVEILERR